jgi:hypothetical protein
MTSAERTIALSALALPIAAELCTLGHAWEYVPPTEDSYSVYLRNGDGARIYLQLTSSKGYDKDDRVLVTGYQHIGKNGQYVEVYDRGADGTGWNRVTVPSITIALSRGPVAIAKDIAKRFLPEYLRVFALAQAKVAADNSYEAKITTNLQRLAAVAGVTLPTEQRHYNEVNKSFTFHLGNSYHEVKVSDKDVDLKLQDLSFEQAEHIIKYLKGTK